MDKSNQIKKLDWNARSFAMQGMNNEERDFFERLTQSLQERQDDFFQYLKERTLETYHHSEQINAIHTWMQRDGNEPMTDFFPMLINTLLILNHPHIARLPMLISQTSNLLPYLQTVYH